MKVFDSVFVIFSAMFIYGEVHGSHYMKCDQVLTKTEGFFKTPNFPFWNYPTHTTCNYLIKAKPNHKIEITFKYFQLEPPDNGNVTDFLEVFDGRSKNRQQEVYYDGTIQTPFKFIARTSRVIMRFVSNAEFNFRGFYVTYKMIPIPPLCDARSLRVPSGEAICEQSNKEGWTESCVVICNLGYQLLGNVTTHCIDGRFIYPPACVKEDCKPRGCLPQQFVVVHGTSDCDVDAESELATSCDVTCDVNYLFLGDRNVSCENGLFFCPPSCSANPHIMEACNLNATSCPFSFNEVTDFFFSFSQLLEGEKPEIKEFEPILAELESPSIQVLRGISPCHYRMCDVDPKTKKYRIQCKLFAARLQQIKKYGDNYRKSRMLHCLQCQNINCGNPPIVFN